MTTIKKKRKKGRPVKIVKSLYKNSYATQMSFILGACPTIPLNYVCYDSPKLCMFSRNFVPQISFLGACPTIH